MKTIKYPNIQDWKTLTKRPLIANNKLDEIVSEILDNVKRYKDEALFDYSNKFDGVKLSTLTITDEEINTAILKVSKDLKKAISLAKTNITKFHSAQIETSEVIETTPGVKCWRKSLPIEKVGLYIPGGTAPLFSTILMLGIPAILAGCKEIILCSPPDKNGNIHPTILYTANLIGISKIFKIGGAQAIAAMAYGTETIPQVYKIFGPGNQYVTKAKELVQLNGIAIDMPAGPSEVLVIADKTSKPEFIASDLLSQAEHGTDSQVILVSDNEDIINETIKEVKVQLANLPRIEIATKTLKNSSAFVFETIKDCIDFSNTYAPEHLILASEETDDWLDCITNAGSVFIGNYSCESAGDYASGTNHTLPTNGNARNYSGVSLDSFVKKVTFQKLSQQGIQNIGPAIELMAEAEELFAHKNAVTLRLKSNV